MALLYSFTLLFRLTVTNVSPDISSYLNNANTGMTHASMTRLRLDLGFPVGAILKMITFSPYWDLL